MTGLLNMRSRIAALATAAFVSVTSLSALAPDIAHALEPVQRVISPGGIQALLIESRDVGLISFRFSFVGGGDQDPSDKLGTAYFAGYLFNEGAGDHDTKALTARLSRIGAGFSAEALMGSLNINFTAPSAHKDEAFGLLKLAITSPRFDSEPMERARRAAMATLKQESVSPGGVGMRRLSRLVYGSSRYAESIYGTPDSLEAVSVSDVRDYRNRVFARDNLRVAVAGDIDAPTLSMLLDDLFGSLPAKAAIKPLPALEATGGRHEAIQMDLPQTIVMFANTLPRLNDGQSHAANVFNQILSASFTGRLFQVVREREGLVYSVSTGRGISPEWETFWGSLGAAPDKADRALAVTIKEIERLVNEGPSSTELEDAKSAMRGSTYLGLDTSPNLSALLLWMLEHNKPDTYLADYDAAVARITVDDVRAAGQFVVRMDRLISVSVGKTG